MGEEEIFGEVFGRFLGGLTPLARWHKMQVYVIESTF